MGCGIYTVVHHFNPPTPCGVGPWERYRVFKPLEFQSTHPVWGGTQHMPVFLPNVRYFNPPTPCGVGPVVVIEWSLNGQISIHPPRVGWDRICAGGNCGWADFNPPTPCGVGLYIVSLIADALIFQSTHPVWGGTNRPDRPVGFAGNFNPPTPCGVGRFCFQCVPCSFRISIHPPRVGWD